MKLEVFSLYVRILDADIILFEIQKYILSFAVSIVF